MTAMRNMLYDLTGIRRITLWVTPALAMVASLYIFSGVFLTGHKLRYLFRFES
ncbi:MAG: hypothetical protein QOC99_213 [Acidobacteriota bacterium]|jgi:hypothetical protein|nr:hypothetical protein [Acidobacteriota bacterium]